MYLPSISSTIPIVPMSIIRDPYADPVSSHRDAIWTMIRDTFAGSNMTVEQLEFLPSHFHRIYAIRLSNGCTYMAKSGPSTATPSLQHERRFLQSEAAILKLFFGTNLPVPRVLSYEGRGTDGVSSFSLSTRLPGIALLEALPYLSRSKIQDINSQLYAFESYISSCTAHQFGPAASVALGLGSRTWREAFNSMMKSILMDGEDTGVNLPYIEIREAILNHAKSLDIVRTARLVILGFGKPQNVLIDRQTNAVTGLLDFGHAIWGDVAFAESPDVSGAGVDVKGLL